MRTETEIVYRDQPMSTDLAEITDKAMALPIRERVQLAKRLWESLGDSECEVEQDSESAVQVARTRDAELSSGTVTGLSHADVMQAARRALE